jgi:hypothetical protein
MKVLRSVWAQVEQETKPPVSSSNISQFIYNYKPNYGYSHTYMLE